MIHLVLLSGGSGTRLWPLSNSTRSKQFLKVLRDENNQPISMVQRVFKQISNTNIEADVTIAASALQQNSIESQIKGKYTLVLEPERRDTAPAIMLSCAHLQFEQDASDDDTVVVFPIDAFVSKDYYKRIVDLNSVIQAGLADLALLGVKPSHPSEKYGYIIPQHKGRDSTGPLAVECFREKPSIEKAREFIEKGGLWNCGVFAFKLGWIKSLTDDYYCARSYDDLCANYSMLPKRSFDYEVVENADSVVVFSYDGTWKDLGTWNTLTEEMVEESSGRVVLDTSTCKDVHAINETGLPMVIAGLNHAVVVATPDGILVSGKRESATIKELVAQAAASRPMYESRQWGEYRVIDAGVYPDGAKSLSKELIVNKDRQLSYQRHSHRTEVWTVVSGEGEIVLDDYEKHVQTGDVIVIEPFQLHAVKATRQLRIIEVQLGDCLEEEDIERFGYYWI